MFRRKHIVIIGAGVNGLSAALTLSRRPFSFLCRKITIVDQDKAIGGLARHADYCYGLPSAVSGALFWHGFRLGKKMTTIVMASSTETAMLVPRRTGTEYVGGDAAVARRHHQLEKRLARYSRLWRGLVSNPPIAFEGGDNGTLFRLGQLAIRFKCWSRRRQRDFLKIIAQNADDVFNEALEEGGRQPLSSLWNFHSYHGSGLYATVSGTMVSLWSRQAMAPTLGLSSYAFNAEKFFTAYRRLLKWRQVKLDLGKGVIAINTALDGGQQKVVGVKLKDGRVIRADQVLSTLAPDATIALAGQKEFDGELVRRTRHVRGRGLVAKVIIESSAPPAILADKQLARVVITGGRQQLEYQYLDSKYDEYPSAFPLVASWQGKRLSVQVHHQPLRVQQNRDQVKKIVLKQLEEYLPDFKPGRVEVILPDDMAAYAGGVRYDGGALPIFPKAHPAAWHHADLTLDQFWAWRSINGAATGVSNGFAHYSTPLAGLFVGGASSHPGGDLHGMAGLLAAQKMLKSK